ncbi:aminoglycoside phosphotransferase family protein, partial [candidate division KSB1 bacterium]|nr:aminoglycoside phosphotransferase family protein [candidate division KSB1 bacterium]
ARPDQAAEYVIRIAPPDDLRMLFYEKKMMRQEPALHQKIQAATAIPIPTILKYDFSRQTIDRDFLIMNRMPGTSLAEKQSLFPPWQLRQIFRQWGEYVAALHTIQASQYGYLGDHHPMEPQSRWDAAFAIMWSKMLEDCMECGAYPAAAKILGLKLWEKYQSAFDPHCPSVLCHMDLWIENLLVNEAGAVTCLFDFDRACFGDAEQEFAIAEYCGITTPDFWEGYGHTPAQTREWALRRWFYLMYEHQKYIVIRLSARHFDPAGAQRYATECLDAMSRFWDSGDPVF